VEDVCLDHLAPAARCLGEWWETDRLPFTDVTMATARIQSMLRRMPTGRGHIAAFAGNGAVFCAVPGEQHTLGVMMAADLFRRNGWDVGLLLGWNIRRSSTGWNATTAMSSGSAVRAIIR
jgi:methanogenic corrinoid protein MtbC1